MDGENEPVYFRLFQLDHSQGRFLLVHSWVYRRTSTRPELVRSFQEKTGGFWGHAGIHLYRCGVLCFTEKALLAVRDPETGHPVVRRVINPLSGAAAAGMGGPFGAISIMNSPRDMLPKEG